MNKRPMQDLDLHLHLNPSDYKSEPVRLIYILSLSTGIEPVTLRLTVARSNQLSYESKEQWYRPLGYGPNTLPLRHFDIDIITY